MQSKPRPGARVHLGPHSERSVAMGNVRASRGEESTPQALAFFKKRASACGNNVAAKGRQDRSSKDRRCYSSMKSAL